LLTSKTYQNLEEYDPRKGDGPWWYDEERKTHYFNGHYCLEFMLEDDLELRNDVSIDFVSHHREFCSKYRYNPSACRELGMNEYTAAQDHVRMVMSIDSVCQK